MTCDFVCWSDIQMKEKRNSNYLNCIVNNNKFFQQLTIESAIYRIVNTFSPVNHGISITAYSSIDKKKLVVCEQFFCSLEFGTICVDV